MYYLLFKIETSISWITLKGLIQAFLSISTPSDKMLLSNILGLHCCFELEQIYPSSPITIHFFFFWEEKKNHLIMLLLGHLKHWVDVWNEGKNPLSMGLISSVELWVGHFLRTKSHRRNHACADLTKLKESYELSDSGAQIDACLWRQERNPFVARVLWASLVRDEWTSLQASGAGHWQTLKMKLQLRKPWPIGTFWNLPLLDSLKSYCLAWFL